MATMTVAATSPGFSPPGFLDQLKAEWSKIRSARALYVQLLLALVLGIGFSALIALAITSGWDNLSPQAKTDFKPAFTGLAGLALSGIVLIVTGVTIISSEYTSGMIRLTMTVTPERLRVLFAKVAVVALVTWGIGLAVTIGAFFASQAVLGTHAGIPTATIGDSAAQRAIIAAWLCSPVFRCWDRRRLHPAQHRRCHHGHAGIVLRAWDLRRPAAGVVAAAHPRLLPRQRQRRPRSLRQQLRYPHLARRRCDHDPGLARRRLPRRRPPPRKARRLTCVQPRANSCDRC